MSGLALSVLIAPLAAEAQTARKVYRIGVLEVVPLGQNAANPSRGQRHGAERFSHRDTGEAA